MSRKKRIVIAAVIAAVFVLALTIAAFCIFRPQPVADEGKKKDLIKNATTEVNKLEDDGNNPDNSGSEDDEGTEASIPTPGTNSFSHGSIKHSDAYPFWSAVSISLADGTETAMVREEGRLYIAGDTSKTAYFDIAPAANTSDSYDLAYVYTMPCRAKLNIALTAGVTAAGGDGVVGYVYVNDTSNMLIDKTVFEPGVATRAVSANNVILEKGDKIYFRYNKNQSTEKDEGVFYGKVTWVEIDPKDDGSGSNSDDPEEEVAVTAGTISYSHGSINAPDVYPCWETKSVDLSTSELSDMVRGSASNTMYVQEDGSAYLNVKGYAQSAEGHDLLYVYTMPCRAKIDIELHASVADGGSDGVAVYAYRNSTKHCMINHTEVKNTTNKAVGTAKGVIFEKGDKLYFRLNSNGTTADDAGYFYVKLTYVEIDAQGDAFVGEAYKKPSTGGDDVPEVKIAAGTTTYAHDYINYPDMHPGWTAVSISSTDGTEYAMVKEDGSLYVAGDTGKNAYFASNGMAKAAEESDLAYVYTMPCKAKVNIELMTMLTGASDDGIVVSVYADEVSNGIIRKTTVTNGDSLQILTADDIILEKGTKLYFRLNKNNSASKDEGLFQAKITFVEIGPEGDSYRKVTWQDMVSGGVMSGGAYGTYFSHGSINNPVLYPYWETRTISHEDGAEAAMVKGRTANTMYVPGDESAYLNGSGKAQSSADNDLVYIFTMPCKAKVNIFLNASVASANSDGVVVYAYANDTSNCIINRTVVKNTGNKTVAEAKGITLDEGDKIYFRLNKNVTTTDDSGYFYAKITFVNEEPDEAVFQGEELEEGLTWKDLVEGTGTNKGKSYSHGSISSPGTYAYWETISIDLSTGEEKPLVTGSSANHRYVDGDATAYLNSSGKMQSAANHDLVYVFTIPCKAKVNIALNASVTSGSDGVKVSCYLNDMSNYLIDEKTVTRTSNAPAGSVNGITLKAGDKIYFRVNRNGTIENDNGMFYGAITFLNEAP